MIEVKCRTRQVWKGGKKTRLTRRAAYLDAAWEAWRSKHWKGGCGCDPEVGWYCPYHRFDNEGPTREAVALSVQRRKIIDRLARWLMWRDSTFAPVIGYGSSVVGYSRAAGKGRECQSV